jgi:hypothetical protein
MAVNKVVYNAKVLLDLTLDTVTPETLAKGVTAHDKSGTKITGTAKVGTAETWVFEMENGSTVEKAVFVG